MNYVIGIGVVNIYGGWKGIFVNGKMVKVDFSGFPRHKIKISI